MLNPSFAASPMVGSNILSSTADSSYTAPTHSVTLATAVPVTGVTTTGAIGSQILTGTFNTTLSSTVPNLPSTGWTVLGTGVQPGTTLLTYTGTAITISLPLTGANPTVSFICNGIKIEEIDFVATGTTVSGMVQLYLYDQTTYHAVYAQAISGITPSTVTVPFYQAVTFSNLEIPSGWSLTATSFVASQLINVVALGGSL